MITPVVTIQGLREVLNANQSGTREVCLSVVRFYEDFYPMKNNTTTLGDPVSEAVAQGIVTSRKLIHVSCVDASDAEYDAKTVAIFTDTGVLFAYASSEDGIISKYRHGYANVTFDLDVGSGDTDNITFGDTTFINPDATYTVQGVARFATKNEVKAGDSETCMINPYTLQAKIDDVTADIDRREQAVNTRLDATDQSITDIQVEQVTQNNSIQTNADNHEALKGRVQTIEDTHFEVFKRYALDVIYPVGSIYISVNTVNPSTFLGGTWKQIKDRFLLADSETYQLGNLGGEATHKLSTDEMPTHSHGGSTLASGAHTHTASTTSAGAHTHTRGTMEITGAFNGNTDDGNQWNGAFYHYTDAGVTGANGEKSGNNGGYISFAASRSWTGATSSAGAHTHGVTVTSAGSHTHTLTLEENGASKAHNNMPPYMVVRMWQRIA